MNDEIYFFIGVVLVFRYCTSAPSQCSAVPWCFHCSGSVSLFRWCSVVPVLFCLSVGISRFGVPVVFRCSGGVLSFRGYSAFRCSGGVPLLHRCSIVPRVFRVPSFRVPVFLVL